MACLLLIPLQTSQNIGGDMKHFNKIFTLFAFAAAIVLGGGLFYADAQAAASYSASHHGGWGHGGCGPRGGWGGR